MRISDVISVKHAVLAFSSLSVLALTGCGALTTGKTAVADTPSLKLTDTSWMMQLPKGSQCEVPPMIEFSDGQATGDLGCNRFTGNVVIDGEKIRFDQVAVTMKMCAPEYMALEGEMLNLLNKASSAKQTKDALTFFDADGKAIITLIPEVAGSCN